METINKDQHYVQAGTKPDDISLHFVLDSFGLQSRKTSLGFNIQFVECWWVVHMQGNFKIIFLIKK